ncbi:diaminopimelate decarboxylase [Corynebacterium heidelbergense]|uniref:Diaminopimelate decarboxylase n=1 Tax=Corynebacterium heidelbergense TaxID=2055947 RepID=A0A364V3Y4_9CORY|nr:diaminopimelate decarboxylase [Corynebacterium heidelbergense]RAV31326.1 diaminopimelate decarboxylase [Corynebacterium heidelbergense]
MDPLTQQPVTPLRVRTTTTEEFNGIPHHVYPLNTRREDDGVVSIEGVRLTDVAEEYGTPVFVLNETDFRTRCRQLATAFRGGHHVHYASKAFLTVSLCRWIEQEGLALDVASENELAVALAADFPAERITVHGNNKSEGFLTRAVTAGVEFVVVDSPPEIELLEQVAAKLGQVQNVLVRVTPGVHVETHEFIATSHEDQKFGFSLASGAAEKATLACAKAEHLRLRGLHCHVGSQVFEADGFVLAAQRLLSLWPTVREGKGPEGSITLDTLDLGGGYGIAYMPDQEALDVDGVARDLLEQVEAAADRMGIAAPSVNVEPGRAIAGPSTVTVYRVGTVKDVETSDRTTRRYISVDGGMSDNIRPSLYNAEYDCRIVNRLTEAEPVPSRVVGSHCESGDILIADALIPGDVRPGDLLMLGATGAYCYAMSSRYNMMTRPPVVVVSDGSSRTMLRRETVEDILALDTDH